MRTFRIFQHPTNGHEAVKVGFSWPCFFFGLLWTLVKRLWVLFAALLGAVVLISVVEFAITSNMSNEGALMVSLMLNLLFMVGWIVLAAKGNELREDNLRERGYRLVGERQAESPADAIAAASQPVQPDNIAPPATHVEANA
ncbi:DUF2628 domain-containing protein [Luteimonas sp. MJ146]